MRCRWVVLKPVHRRTVRHQPQSPAAARRLEAARPHPCFLLPSCRPPKLARRSGPYLRSDAPALACTGGLTLNLRWLFNGLMLAGAVFGWFIGGGFGQIEDTMRHTGPGVIHYEHDWEEVSESRFKRHYYVESGLILSIGVLFWIIVAREAKRAKDKRETDLAYLETLLKKLDKLPPQKQADLLNAHWSAYTKCGRILRARPSRTAEVGQG